MADNTVNDLFTEEGTKNLAKQLITVRQFKGLSRKESAKNAGVSESWLQKLETCTFMNGAPNKDQLLKYCSYLGISIELQYNYSINSKQAS